ncbi:unnamed protein product, partial [Fusarium langsethiae]
MPGDFQSLMKGNGRKALIAWSSGKFRLFPTGLSVQGLGCDLVHYLDYIFPIQYAFYVDAPDQGGRGWLFFLLERNAPLRNAALTLSAFHQHTFSPYHTENQEHELLKYHTKALQELRHVVRKDVHHSIQSTEWFGG